MARWTLALPTSLAELPNYVIRRVPRPHRGPRPVAQRTGRWGRPRAEWPANPSKATLVRVSDQPSGPEFNEADELAYLRAAPAETILGNHLFVLIQVAALRLGDTPPDLAAAALVIDTVAAMVNAGGDRLGEHVELYRSALAEVQQAYVRAKSSSPA